MRAFLSISVAAIAITWAAHAAAEPDWSKVDAALERTGAVQAGGIHRYGFPRSDLHVTLDGVTIKPALALGGWVGFQPMNDNTAMIMGDLVLTEAEVSPVMAKLLESGVEVTAVHNHLLRASPAPFYMHIGGHGDAVKLAAAIHAALAVSATPPQAASGTSASAIDLDTAKLDEAMGAKGKANGGVYQFSVPRRDPVTENAMTIPASMGSANAANFQPTGDGKAAVTGDFVVTGEEVNPLIRSLRTSGIEVTAIHSHMLDEQPRLFFVHFWGNDDAVKLARGLRGALDQTAAAKM
jgi:hypothetical protein